VCCIIQLYLTESPNIMELPESIGHLKR
jgi:hypothetical protein